MTHILKEKVLYFRAELVSILNQRVLLAKRRNLTGRMGIDAVVIWLLVIRAVSAC